MTIYSGTFILSYIFCKSGERLSNRGKRRAAWCMLCAAVLFPAILAGIRDYTIGTDIATYGHWLFIGAKQAPNPLKFAFSNTSIDFLYSILVYSTAHLFSSEHWLYFFTGLLIYGFTMAGIYRYRKIISISIAWVCFLFLFYGDTLNAMRQCIAMSILLFAFSYFQSGDKRSFYILFVMAFLFHSTAVIGVVFVVVYRLLEKSNSLKMRAWILVGTMAVMLGYAKIVDLAVRLGMLNEKFLKYGMQTGAGFSLNPVIIRLPYLIFIMLFYSVYTGNGENKIEKLFADYIIMMILFEMLTAEMRAINPTLYRVSLYFGMYRYIGMGRVVKSLKSNNRIIVTWVIWILLIATWIYQNIVQGNNQIYPYTSELIGL